MGPDGKRSAQELEERERRRGRRKKIYGRTAVSHSQVGLEWYILLPLVWLWYVTYHKTFSGGIL